MEGDNYRLKIMNFSRWLSVFCVLTISPIYTHEILSDSTVTVLNHN